jgi:hypothetical protein
MYNGVFGSNWCSPIDLEAQPANVELLGFGNVENAEGGDGASEFDRHRVVLLVKA